MDTSFSQPNSLGIYFTKVGFDFSATREYYHLIFTQNFSFGQYLFFYATGDNIVVGLIHLTTDNEGTPEAYMEDDDVVDNMGDDILEEKGTEKW